MLAEFADGEITQEKREIFLNPIPVGRLSQRLDVANAALFLASDEASFVTGTELVIDGGYIAQ